MGRKTDWSEQIAIFSQIDFLLEIERKKISAKRKNIFGQKHVIMRRNVSDDEDMFKETKLLLYFRIENHGFVTKTDIT